MGGHRQPWVYAAALLLLLLTLLTLAAAADLGSLRSLISSGGGRVRQDGVAIRSAIGQPLSGCSRDELSLCSGFLCARCSPEHRVFLPTVVRADGEPAPQSRW